MSNKAANSKESILADVKELLKILDTAIKRMPKMYRQHGAAIRIEQAGYDITYRIHLNNNTYGRAVDMIQRANRDPNKYRHIDRFMSQINSYTGLLKNRTDYKRTQRLVAMINDEWWQWLEWNPERQCIGYKEGNRQKNRLNNKFHLKLKAL